MWLAFLFTLEAFFFSFFYEILFLSFFFEEILVYLILRCFKCMASVLGVPKESIALPTGWALLGARLHGNHGDRFGL